MVTVCGSAVLAGVTEAVIILLGGAVAVIVGTCRVGNGEVATGRCVTSGKGLVAFATGVWGREAGAQDENKVVRRMKVKNFFIIPISSLIKSR
jgi:hypothetical protein